MASEAKHTDGCERQKVTKAATAISSFLVVQRAFFLEFRHKRTRHEKLTIREAACRNVKPRASNALNPYVGIAISKPRNGKRNKMEKIANFPSFFSEKVGNSTSSSASLCCCLLLAGWLRDHLVRLARVGLDYLLVATRGPTMSSTSDRHRWPLMVMPHCRYTQQQRKV